MASLDLPGVGRYAANATLVVAFGKRAPVVDGVTARVYRRYLGLPSDLPGNGGSELWEEVDRGDSAGVDPRLELGRPGPRGRGLPSRQATLPRLPS